MAIIPVPILRSSDMLVQQRLLQQVASDQLDLLRIQDQLSTGRRLQVTSQDAPASVRAMGLQRLSEQKDQSLQNLEATQSYLAASDSAVAGVSSLIIDMRAVAVSMVDNTRTDLERDAAVTEIQRAIEQLVNDGNRRFRGRSLFSGSDAAQTPFSIEGKFVVFHGNEGDLESYADVGLRFDSNVAGNEVFGAISPGKKGSVDFRPIVTEETRLADLRGGQGITKTSILVSDDVNDQVIDISAAETLGDVIDLIEANPPAGRRVTARVSGRGLLISIDEDGGGNLNIREVGGGTAAAELGISRPNGVGVNDLVGDELDPLLTLTTKLDNALGIRATALLKSDGLVDRNNDIVFEAIERGDDWNGVSIQYVDDGLLQAAPGLGVGSEFAHFEENAVAARTSLAFTGLNNNLLITADTPGSQYNNVQIQVANGGALGASANASFDANSGVLTVEIDNAGGTEIQNVINAINTTTPFTATYDGSDPADGGFVATANVDAADINSVSGETGNSGGDANTLFIHIEPGQTKASDVITALEDPGAGVVERFYFRLDEKDGEGEGLEGAGVVDGGAAAVTSGGNGVEFDQSSGFQIVNGGETHVIDIQSAETVEDLLNILNGSSANVHAHINADGARINVRSRLSGSDFQIGENGGFTATHLGIRTFVAETSLAELNNGLGVNTLPGADFVVRRTDGVELEIDVSSAATIQEVMDLINQHADNQDAGRVEARLAHSGNGIQLVELAPTSGAPLSVLRTSSHAAWDLGLVARGEEEAHSSAGAEPQPATADITFPSPDHRNTAFTVSSRQEGTNFNGVQVVIDDSGSSKIPLVTFDVGASELQIVIDPTQTTAQDIVTALQGDETQPFTAELGLVSDPNNDGSGLIPLTGSIGLTSGGVTDPTAQVATAEVSFLAPNHLNSALSISAVNAGPALNDVEITFQDTGGPAAANYDPGAKRLTIDIQAGVTTANDVIAALTSVPEFTASLNTSVDGTNDGSGLVSESVWTTSGGAPETFSGSDVNPLEVESIFNTLIKLSDALEEFDLAQIERLVKSIDEDFRRVNFARAEVGARQQSLDALRVRLEDEQIELKRTISLEIDVDLVATISELTSRQAAFEASLRLIGQTFQLSLLEFI